MICCTSPHKNMVHRWVAPIAIGCSSLINIETTIFIQQSILEKKQKPTPTPP